ncbi:MAG: xanthine dehydrogenase family protein molybdopterin-binding subunit [Opitutaceae bacterium]|nr:xanthine dehydrogenase family protein molybdopterin-binding subunit [Opitutaceae bacterium]
MITESIRREAAAVGSAFQIAVLPPAAVEDLSRRGFLKCAGASALVLAFAFSGRRAVAGLSTMRDLKPTATFSPNAFLSVGTDGWTTIVVNHAEMGQGVATSLPMLIAEELDADWSKVRTEFAPVDPAFNHAAFGIQMTGGSTSVPSEFERLRLAGATARAMLVAAAAAEWKVPVSECRTEPGEVVHSSGKRIAYGALVGRASLLVPPPLPPTLKSPDQFRLLGKPTRRLDSRAKVTGSAEFGLDVRLGGLLTAVVARPPTFGGGVEGFDAEAARAVAGVLAVVAVPSGVAVVARDFWAAEKGREALRKTIRWKIPAESEIDTSAQAEAFAKLARQPGAVAENTGDVAAALKGAARVIEADYHMPYLAHAPMEPLNAVVDIQGDRARVWTGTQFQTMDRAAVAAVLGIDAEKVVLHTTYLGGGFGRRATVTSDWVVEAAQVAKAARAAGVAAPIKVVWTREDDLAGGYYRPMFHHRLVGGLDASGKILAWQQTLVGQSFMAGTPFESFAVKNGVDDSSVEGAAHSPYRIPARRVELHSPKVAVPTLWWRSVGHSHTAMAVECFLDELAQAAGRDPLEVRRELLPAGSRERRALDLAVEKSGYGKSTLPAGHAQGLAVHGSFGSVVAMVAEASVEKGRPRVHRVTAAVDCGVVVNPLTIEAQIQSAVVYALSAILYGEITMRKGRVEQDNFHTYEIARIDDAPVVDVHLIAQGDPIGGVGEPGVPPTFGAVLNALAAATGRRARTLPLAKMTWS